MKLIWLLTKSQFSVYRSRMLMAFCSMMACVCLVVWLVGSFESLRSEFDDKAETYMGVYDLYVTPMRDNGGLRAVLPEDITKSLATHPQVAAMDALFQSRLTASISAQRYKKGDLPMRDRMGIPQQNPMLVGCLISDAPYEMEEGKWPDMAKTTDFVGVLGEGSAKLFQANVGDDFVVFTEAGEFTLKIVGIVKQSEATPDIGSGQKTGIGPSLASLFVPLSVAEQISGTSGKINLLNLRLTSGTNTAGFREQLQKEWENKGLHAGLTDVNDIHFRLNDNRRVRGGKSQAYSAAGMVLACCLFIIFTTLNMGLNEKIRQLSLLRAIGLTRAQIAAQIITESFLLSIPAWIGGLALGTILLTVLHWLMPANYPAHPQLTLTTFLLSGGCALGGGLLAAIIPAWRASRVAPLETGNSQGASQDSTRKWPVLSTILGLLFLSVAPAILFLPGMEPETRKTLYSTAGYIAMFLGVITLAPGLIYLSEFIFSPLISRFLGMNPRFLAYQLTRQMSRTVGTVVSLSIGLGLFVAVQCWGYSMVVPFLPTKEIPDVLVSFLPTGIPDDQWSKITETKGVKAEEFLPLALEQVKIEPKLKNSRTFALVEQDNVLIAGIDLEKAFEGDAPMVNLRFLSGNKKEALELLKKGRHVLIPEGLNISTGLKVGDKISVVPPKHPDQVLDYTIAGIIDFPGWHWLTKTSGMRRQEGGFTAALLLTDFDSARRDFELGDLQFFWMNVEPGTDVRTGNKAPDKSQDKGTPEKSKASPPPAKGGRRGGLGGGVSGELELAMQTLAESNSGRKTDIAGLGNITAQKPFAKVSASSQLNSRVQGMADNSIKAMSQLPLIGLTLTTLALVNTLMASVRIRSREFGLLRALGVTRSGLFRLILGESILIGLTAIALSLCFGIVAAWGSINLCRYGHFFGGLAPSLVIPWAHLVVGFAMTLGLSLLAALWPASRLARKAPLQLLQSEDRND